MVSSWKRKMLPGVVPHCTSTVLPRSRIQHETRSSGSFLPHPSAAFDVLRSKRAQCSLSCSPAWPTAQLWGDLQRERDHWFVQHEEMVCSCPRIMYKGMAALTQHSWIQCNETPALKVILFPCWKKKKIVMAMIKLIHFQLWFIEIPLLNNSLLTQNTCKVLAFSISLDKKNKAHFFVKHLLMYYFVAEMRSCREKAFFTMHA